MPVVQDPQEVARAEAESIGLRYIRTFFEGDCEQSLSMLSDTLIDLGNFSTTSKADLQLGLCSSIQNAIKEPNHTYTDYLNTYLTRVRSSDEIEQAYPDALPEMILPGDQFFEGHHLKEGVDETASFIWPPAYIFMLRKEGGMWTVKGLGRLGR